jgi:hypothetical protein
MVRANLGITVPISLWTAPNKHNPNSSLPSPMLTLPGQPILLPTRGPAPQLGHGVYQRDGYIRASLLGTPLIEGSVRPLRRFP